MELYYPVFEFSSVVVDYIIIEICRSSSDAQHCVDKRKLEKGESWAGAKMGPLTLDELKHYIIKERLAIFSDSFKPKPLWQHVKTRGVYEEIGVASAQTATPILEGDLIQVYRAYSDKTLWVRPFAEFTDGRFKKLSD